MIFVIFSLDNMASASKNLDNHLSFAYRSLHATKSDTTPTLALS